ncbi:MAG TPA: hypothetical protein VIF12_05685 [Micavibrio sp.]|jgi:hypothetical protein
MQKIVLPKLEGKSKETEAAIIPYLFAGGGRNGSSLMIYDKMGVPTPEQIRKELRVIAAEPKAPKP